MKWRFNKITSDKNAKKNKAFSLIELSIVITIISVVLVLTLTNKIDGATNRRAKSTNDKIAIINKALQNYVAKNKILPCPARINSTKSESTYGEAGNCTATSGIFSSGYLVYGAVPIKALGLSADLMSDGFGNKFAYIIDKRFADPADLTAFRNLTGAISVKERKDSTFLNVDNAAIFSLISYGPNGNFAYPANSSTPNTDSSDADEIKNNISGFGTQILRQTNNNVKFDDIVFYQEKSRFLNDGKINNLQTSNDSGEAKTTDAGCSVSVTGIISPSSVPTGSSSLNCNDTANHFSGTFTYTCAANAPITGSCTSCSSGYSYSGGSCLAANCTINGVSGFNNKTNLPYATTATTISSPCASGFIASTPAPSYTCTSSGPATISGNCFAEECTGGNVINRTSFAGDTIHVFTASGSLNCTGTISSKTAQVLVVGGGGGGGGGIGGGGGAGGLVYNASVAIGGSSFSVTIGQGGQGGYAWPGGVPTSQSGTCTNLYQNGLKGQNSSFGSGITAIGGGGGADQRYAHIGYPALPNDGGSGGGGALHCTDQSAACRSSNGNANILQDHGTTTHSSQGFNGGTCPTVTSSSSSTACQSVTAGGGGAGGVGGSITTTGITTSANGGIGKNYSSNFSNLYGASGWFSGGGGGGSRKNTSNPGSGGSGGGGNGSKLSLGAQSGLANTGGGGGGGGHDASISPCQIGGGNGGSGIVIVRYTR
jgi:prepilin-type N-terminal cleavage/methylation domain-containing protein